MYLSFNRISKVPEGLDQALPGVILSLQGNETRLTKRVGIAEMLGRRQTMEDTVAVKIGVQNVRLRIILCVWCVCRVWCMCMRIVRGSPR